MISFFSLGLWALALLLTVPALFLSLEIVLGLHTFKQDGHSSAADSVDLKGLRILIPAHNEGGQILDLLDDLTDQIPLSQVLVVADNCDDDTALLASSTGAAVTIRIDTEKRGKAYALAHGRQVLGAGGTPPEHILFLDADCRVEPNTIAVLMAASRASGHPVQADYRMVPHTDGVVGQGLSAFAFFVMNSLRQRGLKALNAPARITGTGMLIPWAAVEKLHLDHGNLAEDLEMGLSFAVNGTPTEFVPEALVTSSLPPAARQEVIQRQRWEKGSRDAQRRFVPALLRGGLNGNTALFYTLLDLWVPPVMKILAFLIGAGGLSFIGIFFGVSGPFFLLFLAGTILGAALLLAMGTYNQLAHQPFSFHEIKAFLTLKLNVAKAGEADGWVRTARDKE